MRLALTQNMVISIGARVIRGSEKILNEIIETVLTCWLVARFACEWWCSLTANRTQQTGLVELICSIGSRHTAPSQRMYDAVRIMAVSVLFFFHNSSTRMNFAINFGIYCLSLFRIDWQKETTEYSESESARTSATKWNIRNTRKGGEDAPNIFLIWSLPLTRLL